MLPAIRRNPGVGGLFVDPFGSMESRWNQLVNRMFEDGGGELGLGNYPVDIDEDEQHVYVEAEMPGFKREEIDVSMEGSVLTIRAERQTQPQGEQSQEEGEAQKPRTKHLAERRVTRVQRSFSLPDSVDEESVEAKLDDGVLKLTLQKKPERQRRKIDVQ